MAIIVQAHHCPKEQSWCNGKIYNREPEGVSISVPTGTTSHSVQLTSAWRHNSGVVSPSYIHEALYYACTAFTLSVEL